MRVIGIVNSKGGDGKSWLTVLLARLLSGEFGRRVAVIDTDPQGTATEYLYGGEVAEGHDVGSVIMGVTAWQDALWQVSPSLALMPNDSTGYDCTEWQLSAVRRLVDRMRDADRFDYVLIDTPGTWNRQVAAVIEASDVVLAPSNVRHRGSKKAVCRMYDRILRGVPGGVDKLLIVPTRTKSSRPAMAAYEAWRMDVEVEVARKRVWGGAVPESPYLATCHEKGQAPRRGKRINPGYAALVHLLNDVMATLGDEGIVDASAGGELEIEELREDHLDRSLEVAFMEAAGLMAKSEVLHRAATQEGPVAS